MVNELLPRLENITLRFNDQRNEPLHFENVKHCTLDSYYDTMITTLSFSHLESLEIRDPSIEIRFKYNEFFRRHRNLRRLQSK